MSDYTHIFREVFVVRLWREASSPVWRGRIVHLPDQESLHFATLAEAEDFIRRFAPGIELPTPPLLKDLPPAEAKGPT